ncbi:MAG: ComEA family DNA-binding protein [Thiohalomonadales bacterium]
MKKIAVVSIFLLLLVGSLVSTSVFAAASVVNINAATAPEISKSLNGIGLQKAEAIVAYRQANGDFKEIKDLLKVKGIGKKTLSKNEKLISLNSDK